MVKPVLGTMNFGASLDLSDSEQIVRRFKTLGYSELDTAYVYNNGDSEMFLGTILNTIKKTDFSIATKINPRVTGKLDSNGVSMQVEESLKRLNVQCVDTLYLHFPDSSTSIEETLAALSEQFQKKRFLRLGLSNFPSWLVVLIHERCKEYGLPQPWIYQGLYNIISRSVEDELFPALRKIGMSFYAYNPLAGGLLTGRYSRFDDVVESGRFVERPNYKDRYWTKSTFDILHDFNRIATKHGMTLVELSLRWMIHHSHLSINDGDGIIIGASNVVQLEENIRCFDAPALPGEIIEAVETVIQQIKLEAPRYFRYA